MKKLSLTLLSLILVSIITLGMVMDALFDQFFSNEDDSPLHYQQKLGTQLSTAINQQSNPTQFIADWHRNSQANDLQMIAPTDLPLPAELSRQLQAGIPLILETNAGLTLYYWLPLHQKILAFSPEELVHRQDSSMVSIALTSGFYFVLLCLLALWLLPLIRSLRSLRRNALSYGKGDFSVRLKPHRFSYIDDIEHTFNQMADQIETLIQDNKLISSAVSHDLRTPLARLRFGIDILSDTEDPEERAKYQEHLSNDIDEMQSLVEALLNYARLEQSLVSVEKEDVDLLKILTDFRDSHPQDVVTISAPALSTAHLQGQPTYLKMMIHNILNNALHYGKSKILVTIAQDKKKLSIHIHDDGNGIPAQQQRDIFKPFVRGNADNGQQGYGMGLAIAERIAQWHQGHIEVSTSADLGGAQFKITLNRAS